MEDHRRICEKELSSRRLFRPIMASTTDLVSVGHEQAADSSWLSRVLLLLYGFGVFVDLWDLSSVQFVEKLRLRVHSVRAGIYLIVMTFIYCEVSLNGRDLIALIPNAASFNYVFIEHN